MGDVKHVGGTTWDCVQCSAHKQNGARCTRWTCKYSEMCWQHTRIALGLRIGPSNIAGAGQGLFATRAMQDGHVICTYGGPDDVVVREEAEDDNYVSNYVLLLDDEFAIDAKSTQSGLGRWAIDCLPVNQGEECEDNNAEFEVDPEAQTARLVAIADIAAGDEIFASYGEPFWRSDNEEEGEEEEHHGVALNNPDSDIDVNDRGYPSTEDEGNPSDTWARILRDEHYVS